MNAEELLESAYADYVERKKRSEAGVAGSAPMDAEPDARQQGGGQAGVKRANPTTEEATHGTAGTVSDTDMYDGLLSNDALSSFPTSSLERHIDESNLGFKMLQKMGWSRGVGLGRAGQGRVEPVPFEHKQDFLGVGKKQQDDAAHADSTAQRRLLDSERMLTETEAQRKAREDLARRTTAIQAEVQQSLSAFYCELCDKQYSKVSEMNAHLDSYDHNHRKRFKAMKEASRKKASVGGGASSREKEKAREEKELRKMQAMAEAAAGGAKLKTGPPVTASTLSAGGLKIIGGSSGTTSSAGGGGGWKSIVSGGAPEAPSGGWKQVGSGSMPVSSLPVPATSHSGNWSGMTPGEEKSGTKPVSTNSALKFAFGGRKIGFGGK